MRKSMKETVKEYFAPSGNAAPIKNEPQKPAVVVAVDERSAAIEAHVENAKRCGGYQCVPLYLLSVPRYQRRERGKVKKIASEWNEIKCDPLKVSYRDGKLWVVDGRQRGAAATLIGKGNLMCRIITGMTELEEFADYEEQNDNKASMSVYDKIVGRAALGLNPGKDIMRICAESGVVLSDSKGKVGECSCPSAIQFSYKTVGEAGMKWVFRLIDTLGWKHATNGYKAALVRAMTLTYAEVDNTALAFDRLTNKLGRMTPDNTIELAKDEFPGRTSTAALVALFQKVCG